MSGDVSTLLAEARSGAEGAAQRVFELLYGELKSLAHGQLNRHADAPLETTTLVHEAYLKLMRAGTLRVEDRRHFLAYASTVMRSIVVDFARGRLADKRGGRQRAVTLDSQVADAVAVSDDAVVQVHDALGGLAELDARMAKIVEMRYFAGLSEPEVAEALDLSVRTVQREWEKARLYLAAELAES